MHNLLSIHQSAYWSTHSTETVLLCILNNILTYDNKIWILLLLALSAAFDTVDHEILLSHLNFGIHGTALK